MSGPDTDGTIKLDLGTGAGGTLDTTQVAFGADNRQRERVVIGGDQAAELADVLNSAPATASYGLVVRPIHLETSTFWSVSAAPAAGVAASATQGVPGGSKQNVVTSVTVSIAAGDLILVGAAVEARVTDGTGAILWRGVLGITAVIGSSSAINVPVTLPVGTNKTVTIAFTAGAANAIEAVSMSGYVQPVN